MDPVEPTFEWEEASQQYDTSGIRKQLGIHDPPLSNHERGILSLAEEDWREDQRYYYPSMDLFQQQLNHSIVLCRRCLTSSTESSRAHRTLTALFQDVFVATNNPALALQALFTTVSQMTYYSMLSEFDLRGNASVTLFVPVSIPQRWTGFTIVVGLVAAHLVCGTLVMVLFFRKCQCSMLGQVWRCIAQVRSGDTDVVLKKASVATDDDIRVWLKKHGKGETRVGVLPWRRRGTTESA
ncbi:hypothetical protein SLS55_002747 [Diplodia seriata]|uniref:Uncharacterized protein n=1 Tax=Diplodia seriata TaxID=420778 RepID=A0ABR3CT32_9PEZI